MYKKDIDLKNKCGSCIHASAPFKATERGMGTSVKCLHPSKTFKNPWNQVKPRSRDACPSYHIVEELHER